MAAVCRTVARAVNTGRRLTIEKVQVLLVLALAKKL